MVGEKMRLFCFLALISPLLFLSGCATYSNQSFWEVTKTKVELEANNFKVAKLGVQGTASCPYLFGTGGQGGLPITGIPCGDSALLQRAMADLHEQAQLLGTSSFLHNINLEWSTRGVPIFLIIQRLTITADVIEFTDEYRDYKPRD